MLNQGYKEMLSVLLENKVHFLFNDIRSYLNFELE